MAKNKSGERQEIKEESKKKADCTSSVERIEASEKQKAAAAQKSEESRKKIESGSIQ